MKASRMKRGGTADRSQRTHRGKYTTQQGNGSMTASTMSVELEKSCDINLDAASTTS